MLSTASARDQEPPRARDLVRKLRRSQIREVSNAGMSIPGVLPFWLGEPDLPTPAYIVDAAIAALAAGQTRYTPTIGLSELREALARYLSRLHRGIDGDRIVVTSSGTSSLMLALQAILASDDEAVAITPVWPNLCEMPKLLGARLHTVSLTFGPDGWQLDLQRLLDTITDRTRAVIINSPNNPTGWTLSRAEQEAIAAHCRKTGTWIVADDVYSRVMLDGSTAPSFLDIMDGRDRLISCNSFSKAWRMTGWRLGWVVIPDGMLIDFGKIVEYNTTCAPPFVQRAGIVALERGEDDLQRMIGHLRAGQTALHRLLDDVDGVEIGAPAPGGMYSFFRLRTPQGPLQFCKDIVNRVGLGLAPGTAFGNDGEDYLRWCFASDAARIADGVARLRAYLRSES